MRLIRSTAAAVVARRPHVLVIIDSPAFTCAIAKRVRALAPTLPKELGEDAFRVSLGIAAVDDELHDDESELMKILAESLGLSAERAEAITDEVLSRTLRP